jgi:glycosyltransferase involved in cell wall biosynthesis
MASASSRRRSGRPFQAEPPLEVIVVDDASTDATSQAARAAGARVLRTETHRNAGGARNLGIEASSGDVLAFLDADVVAPADWLARVRAAFANDPQVVAVGGSVVNGRPGVWGDLDLYLNHSEWIGGRPSVKGLIPTLGVAYRRAAPGMTFGGVLIWPEDQGAYASFIRQAADASGATRRS